MILLHVYNRHFPISRAYSFHFKLTTFFHLSLSLSFSLVDHFSSFQSFRGKPGWISFPNRKFEPWNVRFLRTTICIWIVRTRYTVSVKNYKKRNRGERKTERKHRRNTEYFVQNESLKISCYGFGSTRFFHFSSFQHAVLLLLFFFFLSFFHFLETELLRLTKHDNSIYRFCNDSLNVLYYYDLLHPLGQLWQALGIRLTKLQTLFFLSSAPYYRPTCICTCICTVFL